MRQLGTCTRCDEPAVRLRLLRLGDREWRIPLCQAHLIILELMVHGWTRHVEQQIPVTPPPSLVPTHPLADMPAPVRNLFTPVDPEPQPRPKGVPRDVPPASRRSRSELRLVQGLVDP